MEQSNNLNEKQKQDLMKRRQEMFKKMGVSNAGQMMNESVVASNGNSMAARLAAIKNGSARPELSKFMQATGKSAPGQFQGIPEPSKKRNQNKNKEEIKPEYKQELESFSTPQNQELSAIESMFGGDSPVRMSSMDAGSQMIHQNPMIQDLNIDTMAMPSFNPQAAIQQKARNQAQQQQQQEQPQSQYFKYANNTPVVGNEQFEDVGFQSNQPMFNANQLQVMMETIAKGIAEKTIRSVLSEYTQQQKGKLSFEYYNKEKSIIKASDGKYYRLTQVELKKKQ